MDDRTLTCPTCGATAQATMGVSNGQIFRETGFKPVATYMGSFLWICPDCWPKAKALATQLFEMMGTRDFYFPSLLREMKID